VRYPWIKPHKHNYKFNGRSKITGIYQFRCATCYIHTTIWPMVFWEGYPKQKIRQILWNNFGA
jgi:hypothetical protein